MSLPTFRPLTADDLPLVLRWFNAPHARRWFGQRGHTLEEVREEYLPYIDGAVPIHPYAVLLDGRPIGLCTWERMGDFPELMELYRVTDPDAANCDILIGDAEAVYLGWGSRIVRSLLGDLVFGDPRITTCIIDPHPDNSIAIRCYEKAGFRFLRAVAEDGEGDAVMLLELARADFARGRGGPVPPYIRPGRVEELEEAVAIDDDACSMYPTADPALDLALPDDHPYVVAEAARWTAAARQGRLLFSCVAGGEPIGFAVLDLVEGRHFLEQVSVRRAWMRRGVGRSLLERAQRWSVRPGELWLTTYDHVPWNRPWYERRGFEVVAGDDCPTGVRAILEAERAALPQGARRVVMRYRYVDIR